MVGSGGSSNKLLKEVIITSLNLYAVPLEIIDDLYLNSIGRYNNKFHKFICQRFYLSEIEKIDKEEVYDFTDFNNCEITEEYWMGYRIYHHSGVKSSNPRWKLETFIREQQCSFPAELYNKRWRLIHKNKTTRSLYKAYKNMYTVEDASTRERSSK